MTIDGDRELIQRALLRLTIKKGSFKQDLSLGSDFHKLRGIHSGNLARIALSYAQEALLPMPEVSATDIVIEQKDDVMRLFVSLSINTNQYQLEVDVS